MTLDFTGLITRIAKVARACTDDAASAELGNILADAGHTAHFIHRLVCTQKITEELMAKNLYYALTTNAPKSYDYGQEIESMELGDNFRVLYFNNTRDAQTQQQRNLSGLYSAKLTEKPIGFTQLVAALFDGKVEV